MILLSRSASLRGYLIFHYPKEIRTHIQMILEMIASKKLKPLIDNKKFLGLEEISDAIDWMYQGKNVGKVVVNSNSKSVQSKL